MALGVCGTGSILNAVLHTPSKIKGSESVRLFRLGSEPSHSRSHSQAAGKTSAAVATETSRVVIEDQPS